MWGSPLPTSPTHHQGEQEEEKERQGPQESFIILNAQGAERKVRKKKKGENTNPIIHTTEWGWYGMVWHEVEAWSGGQRNPPPHIPFSLWCCFHSCQTEKPSQKTGLGEEGPLFTATLKFKEILLRQRYLIRYFEKIREDTFRVCLLSQVGGHTGGWDEGGARRWTEWPIF